MKCRDVSEDKVLNLRPDEERDKSHFTDKETGQDMEIVETMPLLEWFANNYKVRAQQLLMLVIVA